MWIFVYVINWANWDRHFQRTGLKNFPNVSLEFIIMLLFPKVLHFFLCFSKVMIKSTEVQNFSLVHAVGNLKNMFTYIVCLPPPDARTRDQ